MSEILAAGAVVLRTHGDRQQVLLVHRPHYDDWSLPKGKLDPGETLPQTACREVREETGVEVRLDLALPPVAYEVRKGPKTVHFWRAQVVAEHPWKPDHEVDQVRWLGVSEALECLTYASDAGVLQAALDAPPSTALVVLRHARAVPRKKWEGPDHLRELAESGHEQAKDLVGVLGAFGVERVVSSAATRCMETVTPYARAAGLEVHPVELLTEEQGEPHPDRVASFMAGLAAGLGVPTVVCGHRPVLPDMLRGLGQEPRPLAVAEMLVVHLSAGAQVLAAHTVTPTA